MEANEGCATPRGKEYQIPAALVCPPPPRKKTEQAKMEAPPRNGYFQSPEEIEAFFRSVTKQQGRVAWA